MMSVFARVPPGKAASGLSALNATRGNPGLVPLVAATAHWLGFKPSAYFMRLLIPSPAGEAVAAALPPLRP